MTLTPTARAALETVYGAVPDLPVSREDWQRMRLAIASIEFEREFSDKQQLEDFLEDDVAYSMHNRINIVMSEVIGIGPDLFSVNSLSHPDLVTTADTTLLDFDRAHAGEINATVAEATGEPVKPYRESLYGLWTRRVENDRQVYGFLYAAGPFLWSALEDAMYEWGGARYPSKASRVATFEELSAYFDRVTTNPTRTESVRHEVYAAGSRLMTTMLEDEGGDRMFDQDEAWVYRELKEEDGELKERVVFSNAKAMEKVRFGHFVSDLDALPSDEGSFAQRLTAVVTAFLFRLKAIAEEIETSAASAEDT